MTRINLHSASLDFLRSGAIARVRVLLIRADGGSMMDHDMDCNPCVAYTNGNYVLDPSIVQSPYDASPIVNVS